MSHEGERHVEEAWILPVACRQPQLTCGMKESCPSRPVDPRAWAYELVEEATYFWAGLLHGVTEEITD